MSNIGRDAAPQPAERISAVCTVCFRHCRIPDGKTGFCGARRAENGQAAAENYGRLTALALDPIEKKPLARFYPGTQILSVGSYGCNLACPFCQNFTISREWKDFAETRQMDPEELAALAERLKSQGNIGVAFTYNEPLVGWEYVRDAAREVRRRGMKTVLVTNGCASQKVLSAILPYIDAMNIDLKGFTEDFYADFAGGDLGMVKDFIRGAVQYAGGCHVELTTLIIPGKNDSADEMRAEAAWIRSLDGGRGEVPLHVTRYFPRFRCRIPATPVRTVSALADIARSELTYVYVGNC